MKMKKRGLQSQNVPNYKKGTCKFYNFEKKTGVEFYSRLKKKGGLYRFCKENIEQAFEMADEIKPNGVSES